MKRVRATALLAAFGLLGYTVRGDDVSWKTSAPVAPPAAPPTVVTAPPPAASSTPPPVAIQSPAPTQSAEATGWVPSNRPSESTLKPATPAVITLPTTLPTATDVPIVFRPAAASHETAPPPLPSTTEPRPLVPEVLPPLAKLPQPVVTTLPEVAASEQPPVPKLPELKPADPKPPEKLLETKSGEPKPSESKPTSESLPPPRPTATQPGPVPAVTAYGSALTPSVCPPPPPTPVEQAGNPAPTRRKVFGSPEMMLSRDYAFRDLFGMDLLTEPRGRLRDRLASRELGDGTEPTYFVQAELLLWWTSQARIPAIATTSASGTGTGFLGDGDTRTLLGPGRFGPTFQPGFRVRAGAWLDGCGSQGIDGSYFFLGRGSEKASFDSSQFPVITRPIFAPNFNSEFGETVARPGISTGRLEVEQDSLLWGADLNYKCAVCRTCDGSRGWFVGYRHLNLTERLNITEFITATSTDSGDPVGTRVVVGDRFETRNRFHGGQVGYWWQRQVDRWEVDARASVALGVTSHVIDISGFQQRTRPGEQTQSFTGGLLATGPNLGQFHRSSFSVAPEVTFNLGYRLTDNLKVYGGYNFLYWSNVMRPGDQIDRVVDVTLVPNPPPGVPSSGQNRPLPTFTKTDFWAQGVQFGLEFRW